MLLVFRPFCLSGLRIKTVNSKKNIFFALVVLFDILNSTLLYIIFYDESKLYFLLLS